METKKLGSGFAWVFALAALVVGLAGGYFTAGLGAKVSGGIEFGTFAVFGFLATFLTRAKTGAAVAAFVLSAVVAGGGMYFVVAHAVAQAATNVGGDGAVQAGNTMGAFFGVFLAAITLIGALVAGIGGCVTGARVRDGMASAAA